MTQRRPEGQPLPPDLVEQLRSALSPAGQRLLQDLLSGKPAEQVLSEAAGAVGLCHRELQRLLTQPEALTGLVRQALAGGKVDPAAFRPLLEASGLPPTPPGRGTRPDSP